MTMVFDVRFEEIPGIADSEWISFAPGVTILTGHNNVGKTRLLNSVNSLKAAANGQTPEPAPWLRVAVDEQGRYVETRPLANAFPPYRVVAPHGTPEYEASYQYPQGGGQAVLRDGLREGGAQTGLGHVTAALQSMSMLPHQARVLETLSRLVYIPPHRPVTAVAQTSPAKIPSPSGTDLGQALYTHLNEFTSAFDELQDVMRSMFPEVTRIMTHPSGPNQVTVRFRDRFSGQDISIDNAGTGLGQILHLVAAVLMYPVGRLFLIDEPHIFLHPAAERQLVKFLNSHDEHSYVVATHSPVFINAARAERMYLVTRDERGSTVRRVMETTEDRRNLMTQLGVLPSDVALSERVLFVEGRSDVLILPVLLRTLGWDVDVYRCSVIQLQGAGTARPLREAAEELSTAVGTRLLVLLDGDKKADVSATAHVTHLPTGDIEGLLVANASAVVAGLADAGIWTDDDVTRDRIGQFIAQHPSESGKKILTDLVAAFGAGQYYSPTVHGPMIANHLSRGDVASLIPVLEKFFEPLE